MAWAGTTWSIESAHLPGALAVFPSELPLPAFGGAQLGKAGDAGFLGCPGFSLQAGFSRWLS